MSESSNKFDHNNHINTVGLDTHETVDGGASVSPTSESGRGPSRRGLLIGGLAALATGAITIPIALGIANTANDAPGAMPGIESGAQLDPSATPSKGAATGEVVFDIEHIASNVVEQAYFDVLNPEQQEQIRELDAISDIKEFRALPETDQLLFAELVYRNNLPRLEYGLSKLNETQVLDDVKEDGAIGINARRSLVIALMTSLNEKNDGEIRYDALTAKKLAILINSAKENDAADRFAELDAIVDMMNLNTPPVVVTSTVEGSLLAKNGDIIMNTLNTSSGERSQQVYSPITFKSIEGTEVTLDRVILAIPQDDPRYVNF